MNKLSLPKDGIEGLKENFSSDALSGFIVFLLALPLSLGIAKASDFPPLMGLLTAIVGGMVVSAFMGSKLTIKGPAAGLIVIVAGSVADFGGGQVGWHLALGAMFVAAVVQILFGIFKFGRFADFFPLSTIHGMLAAIGIIIILKQIPVLFDVDPVINAGKGPLELLMNIPYSIANLNVNGTIVGLLSLIVVVGWPFLKKFTIGKIPAPLVVLMVAIPLAYICRIENQPPPFELANIGNLAESITVNVDFAGFAMPGIFIKYVVMFALVGSLESLLTVKAIDLVDPYKRKSDYDKDLVAVGVGNSITAVLGGLPMISEVARSSANVSNGAKTRWSNFFHGFFILLFVLIASQFIEMIPNAALAAMLIGVGIKLAHPQEFVNTFKIGKDQLAIFLVTIFFTLYEDLLIGIAAGIVMKIIFHLLNGVSISSMLKSEVKVSFNQNVYLVVVEKSAVFTNYLGLKSKIDEIPPLSNIVIDLSKTKLVDHSVLSNLNNLKQDYDATGGSIKIIGLEHHQAFSKHEFAARKQVPS